jgi:hypothetical protein
MLIRMVPLLILGLLAAGASAPEVPTPLAPTPPAGAHACSPDQLRSLLARVKGVSTLLESTSDPAQVRALLRNPVIQLLPVDESLKALARDPAAVDALADNLPLVRKLTSYPLMAVSLGALFAPREGMTPPQQDHLLALNLEELRKPADKPDKARKRLTKTLEYLGHEDRVQDTHQLVLALREATPEMIGKVSGVANAGFFRGMVNRVFGANGKVSRQLLPLREHALRDESPSLLKDAGRSEDDRGREENIRFLAEILDPRSGKVEALGPLVRNLIGSVGSGKPLLGCNQETPARHASAGDAKPPCEGPACVREFASVIPRILRLDGVGSPDAR